MRHRKKGKVLDRPKGKRQALLRGLVTNLILFEKINTTKAKAKAIRPLVERLITVGKRTDLASKRYVAGRVYTDGARKKIFEVLGPRYGGRAGGYTRIINLSRRVGDGAELARIEFI